MLDSIILIFLLASLDRLREICDFDSWFKESVFAGIKNQFWFKWFRSYSVDKFKEIKIGGRVIPLHPVFYDGYHFFKNLFAVILLIYFSSGIYQFLILALAWYTAQKIIYKILCEKT